eukprot:31103-Pelagococcus_subviridis.AAC.15
MSGWSSLASVGSSAPIAAASTPSAADHARATIDSSPRSGVTASGLNTRVLPWRNHESRVTLSTFPLDVNGQLSCRRPAVKFARGGVHPRFRRRVERRRLHARVRGDDLRGRVERYRRVRDERAVFKRRLDVVELDAVPAYFHPSIDPPEKDQVPGRHVYEPDVAAAIDPP